MHYTLYSLADKPEFCHRVKQLDADSWPLFLRHGDNHHWYLLFDRFPMYQLLLCDAEDELMAVGHTVPLVWSGEVADLPRGIEDILLRAEAARRQQQSPNTVCALAAMVSSERRGRNLSARVLQEMRALARRHECAALLAPVRPTWKSRYPLAPMERYVTWTRGDGAPLDPWLRVHWRLGVEPLGVAPNTLTVEGTIQEWESWTGMAFPESGHYVVPGALQPVVIDCERNVGRYEDPNYWVKHPV